MTSFHLYPSEHIFLKNVSFYIFLTTSIKTMKVFFFRETSTWNDWVVSNSDDCAYYFNFIPHRHFFSDVKRTIFSYVFFVQFLTIIKNFLSKFIMSCAEYTSYSSFQIGFYRFLPLPGVLNRYLIKQKYKKMLEKKTKNGFLGCK